MATQRSKRARMAHVGKVKRSRAIKPAAFAASPASSASIRLRWLVVGATAAIGGNFALAAGPHAGLPNPCPGSVACAGHAFDPLSTGSTLNFGANQLTIHQVGASAIFNWQSFNISPGNSVTFVQPSASSVALNRIYDPNVTSIAGNLTSNGQIYLVNPNGILFGSGAQVDVGGLIASTLNIRNSRITAGLLSDTNLGDPAFTNNPAIVGTDLTASAGANPAIVVQQGASLYSAGKSSTGAVVSAGRIFLFAPTVEVAGKIQVDGGGQAVVASGSDVYLGSSTDPSLRGLLVAVSPAAQGGIKVDATGNISVARGNISLVGLAINQSGTLSATSALEQNGSIDLLARAVDPALAANVPNSSVDPLALDLQTRTGSVTLASGSQTTVRLDPSDTASLPFSDPTAAALRSSITIQGQTVAIGGTGAPGSTLVEAHGGDITVNARAAQGGHYQVGDGSLLGTLNSAATVQIGADAKLDVSGLQNVAMDGALNYAYISRLTSLNLANAPFQRTGFLLGQGVYLNLQDAPSWINVSNLQSAIAGTQAQRNTAAGTIALQAEGSVKVAAGATLDVSGGSLAVSAATGRTTQLLTAGGQAVTLNAGASPDVQYVGFTDGATTTTTNAIEGINVTASWQAPVYTNLGGYTQGANAGTVEIYAPSASMAGTLLGHVTTGPFQRSKPPAGGQLLIGSSGGTALDTEAGFSRGNIYLTGNAANFSANLSAAQASQSLVVDTNALAAGGFTRYNLTSDGLIELTAGDNLNLGPTGIFSARGNAIQVNSSITAPGGTISLTERPLTTSPGDNGIVAIDSTVRDGLSLIGAGSPVPRGAVWLGAGVALDVAGFWTNDAYPVSTALPTAPLVINGGSITLSGRNVDVSGASFDVSAGATLSKSGIFSGGKGGALSITATDQVAGAGFDSAGDRGILTLGPDFAARVSGYGVTAGASLVIGAPTVAIEPAGTTVGGTVVLQTDIGARGFSSYTFNAYDTLTVGAGVNFSPSVLSVHNSSALDFAASQSSLLAVVAPQAPLPGQLAPASVTLLASSPSDGNVILGKGATINAGIAGAISLTAGNSILDDGNLLAPGGSVSASLLRAGYDEFLTSARLDGRTIQLGPDASIDVAGASLVVEQSTGLRTGSVLDAGFVSLSAPAGIIAVDGGASIVANGTADTVDIINNAGIVPQTVASSGGTLAMSADLGLYFGGNVNAAGGGSGAAGGKLSVALQVGPFVLANGGGSNLQPLVSPTNLVIGSSLPTLVLGQTNLPIASPVGIVTPSLINGSGFDHVWLQSADRITFSQSVALNTRASLVLSGQEIAVGAGDTVTLQAPYVALGGVAQLNFATNGASYNALSAATGGTGSLRVNADLIDLVGSTSLLGVGTATLNSSGDLRAIGSPGASLGASTSARVSGSFQFGGNLAINAAQIYPATQTDFTFTTTAAPGDAANGNIQITSVANAANALAPLSAGGSLAFAVNNFTSSGRVLAPAGSIDVNAIDAITLASGSLLSVSANALVPYGTVLNGGTAWTYNVPPNSANTPIAPFTIATSTGDVAVPGKGVTLLAPTVDAKSGSTVDIAGGKGDMLGTGFVAGPGGSYDMSLNFPFAAASGVANTRNTLFALIPSRGTAFAAYDPQIYTDLVLNAGSPSSSTASFQFGQTITIGAGSGIPGGTYTILPPRYALLPGAFAVEAAAGYFGISPGTAQTMPDGSVIVAGKLGIASAGTASSNWSGYRVFTGTQFRTMSQFSDYAGDQFFSAAAGAGNQALPRVAPDAGILEVSGTNVLLQSTIDAAPVAGGRGADVSIAAQSIVIDNMVPEMAQASSQLALSIAQLSGLGAETLIIGAAESRQAGGTAVSLSNVATSVTDSATTPLSAGEVLLAGQSVTMGANAQIVASTNAKPQTSSIAITGDGAALYVGNAAIIPSLTRAGASAPGAATVGALTIDNGATIAGGAVLFDATRSQSYPATFSLTSQNVGLSAATVNLGAVPAGISGLDLSNNLLAQLSTSGALTITSQGGFDVFGTPSIGALNAAGQATLASVTLVGPGVSAAAPGAQLTIDAGRVALDNSLGQTLSAAGSSGGTLRIHAVASATSSGNVDVAGNFALSGFQGASITAVGRTVAGSTTVGTGDLLFTGAAGQAAGLTLDVAGAPLSIDATRITASRGVNATISTPGSLAIAASGPATTVEASELGASLAITATSVDMAGRIDLPAGVVAITTTGATTLEPGSSIRVAGVSQSFGAVTADASAGSIAITSTAGSVVQNANATLDLSGAGVQGDAGRLALAAPTGNVQVSGKLLLQPGTAARGADVSVDAGQIASLPSLLAALATGTGTGSANSIAIRSRNGDLAIAAGESIKAGSILLEADGNGGPTDGSILVAGTLDASGPTGGRINLYANDQVTIAAGALLDAHATGAGADGGQVLISSRVTGNAAAPTTLDAIVLQSGASINVAAGDANGTGGSVTLRANAAGGANPSDVEICSASPACATPGAVIAGQNPNAGIIVEGVVVQQNAGPLTIDATALAADAAILQSYMSAANRTAMATRLGEAGDPSFSLRPGLEIQSTGSITLASSADFAAGLIDPVAGTGSFTWRYGGSTLATSDPGALTLRSAGNLLINASITDGFAPTTSTPRGTPAGSLNGTVWSSGNSWRYTLTAGADLNAANPNAVATQAGSLYVGSAALATPVTIRTGTGSIGLTASQDIVLGNGGNSTPNVVYTAGVADVNAPAFPALVTTYNGRRAVPISPTLTQGGGDLTITAGGNIEGTDNRAATNLDGSVQSVSEWLYRGGLGTAAVPTVWWVNFSQFQQGFGALGGGNLNINAGGDLVRVDAMLPSNGYNSGSGISQRNAGSLIVNAGGNIVQGMYYDEAGTASLRATALVANPLDLAPPISQQQDVRFALGSGTLDVQMREASTLAAPFNPTAFLPALPNAPASSTYPTSAAEYDTTFFTYGANATLDVRAAAGNVSMLQAQDNGGPGIAGTFANISITQFSKVIPPIVRITAFGGNATSDTNLNYQAPSATGQFEVLADGNVNQWNLVMSQADPATLPQPAAPQLETGTNINPTALLLAAVDSSTPLHASDPTSAEIIARNGSMSDNLLVIPKTTQILAAGSISDLVVDIQNSNVGSLSEISAGTTLNLSGSILSGGHINIAGPGAGEVLSGGAMSLGTDGTGIQATANVQANIYLANSNLGSAGASLIVAAGTGLGSNGFAAEPQYLNVIEQFVRNDAFAAAGTGSAALNAQVLAYVSSDASLSPLASLIGAALANRSAAAAADSSFRTALAGISPAALAVGATKLASGIQIVANQQFVNSQNQDTFAPAYAAFDDLFPNLNNSAAAIRQFIAANPFANASNASALQSQALVGLPAAVVDVVDLGIANPAAVSVADSAFSTALAALDPATLAAATRQLLANTLMVAGTSRNALQSSGRLVGFGSPYAQGLTAFAAAYSPRTTAGLNDLSFDYNQITVDGSGTLAVFTPQGSVVVGQSNPPALDSTAAAKLPYQLGMFTLGGGDIIGMARDNFDVFESRVFTVAGGDINLWSSLGNVDAGKGPRDAAVAAPPVLVVNTNTGIATLNFSASVTGSGIGALVTQPDQPPSNINLMAPLGYVDAGEAGIRAQGGSVTLGTNLVLNAGNIQAAGGISGGAIVAAPPPPAPPSTGTSSGDKAAEEAQRDALFKEEAALQARQSTMLVVGEFLQYGGDDCKDPDSGDPCKDPKDSK